MKIKSVLCLVFCVPTMVACGSSSKNSDGSVSDRAVSSEGLGDGAKLRQCPPQGLGVMTTTGTNVKCSTIMDPNSKDLQDCVEQVTNWQTYACSQPQLCPDSGSQMIASHVVGNPGMVSFTLTNCSTGNSALKINKVSFEGDTRCAFSFNAKTDLSTTTILPGKTAFIQTTYNPTLEGEDHAALRIETNAQNYGMLKLPVCGYTSNTTPSLPFRCTATTTINLSCH